MTTQFQRPAEQVSSFWDAAAGGIFPGLLGGVAMLVLLIAGGYLAGHTPAQVLSAFDTAASLPLRGALIHLAISCVYGALFALLDHGLSSRPRSFWSVLLLGLLYGLLLWLVAVTMLGKATASLLSMSVPAVFLLAHLAYGLALGLLFARR